MDLGLRQSRHAVRALVRTPGFTATAVLILALAIAVNSLVFSAVDAILLRPLPFPDADRLVRVQQVLEQSSQVRIAPVRLEDWHRLNTTFAALSGYYTEDVSETSGEYPERVRRAMVAPRFFDVWGVAPAIGRDFTEAERTFGGPSAVIVSDRFFRARLGADPQVLTRSVRIGAAAVPIVGVMPASFMFPEHDVDLWFPVAVNAPFAQSRTATWYTGIGRLRPGVAVERARADLTVVQARLAAEYPVTDATVSVMVEPLKEVAVASARGSLWLAYGGVSVLLFIACTNIAGLLLVRSTARRREMAVRTALGASRASLVTQLLVETAIVALAGAALGLWIASAGVGALRAATDTIAPAVAVGIDARIAFYTAASAVVVTLVCGVAPAVQIVRGSGALVPGSRTIVGGGASLQWWLVGMQVAGSVTLLAGALLLVRSALALSAVDPGFRTARVLTFRVSGAYGETSNYARLVQRIDGMIAAISELPGVEAVATSDALPGVSDRHEAAFSVVAGPAAALPALVAESRVVSPGYFAAMQIPLFTGEGCRSEPFHPTAARQVVVNRRFVERYFPNGSIVGVELARSEGGPPGRIVGVAADARERGVEQAAAPTVYTCLSAPSPTPHVLVRTTGDPTAIAAAVRSAVKGLEPLRSVYDLAPLDRRIGAAFAERRLRTLLLVGFAAAALLLSCVGVYATLSYVTAQRRREIGLRLALGASRSGIVWHVVLRGVRVAAVAAAAGVVLALVSNRVLAGMLFGVAPGDPATLAAVVAVVLVMCALAAFLPAARAARVEPMEVLTREIEM